MIRINKLIVIRVFIVTRLFYNFSSIVLFVSYSDMLILWKMPYVDTVIKYMNCTIVKGRAPCKTAYGWWVIQAGYVLKINKKLPFKLHFMYIQE